jgi:fucose permease
MKKPLKKIVLILSIGLFMTSCFPTKQSCGLAHIEKTVKKAPTKILNTEEAVSLN